MLRGFRHLDKNSAHLATEQPRGETDTHTQENLLSVALDRWLHGTSNPWTEKADSGHPRIILNLVKTGLRLDNSSFAAMEFFHFACRQGDFEKIKILEATGVIDSTLA